jgi:hypothetical protein
VSWNYRVVRYRDGSGFGLHEVYYDKDGQPWGMTESAARFTCVPDEGPGGIRDSLRLAATDARLRPVLDEPGTWPGIAP